MQSWGGGEEFILKVCKNIKKYNFIIASPNGEASEIFKKNKLNVISKNQLSKIYKSNAKWPLTSILKSIIKIKLTAFSLSAIIYKDKINLLIANGNFAALFSIFPSIIMRKKLLVIQHLIYNTDSLEAKLLKIIIRFSDRFICVSNAVKDNILSVVGNNYSNKIEVIHNGIELTGIEKIDSTQIDDKIKIGIVGSIIRIKGIDLVIDSLIDMLNSHAKVHLYIYGSPNNQDDSAKYNQELITKVRSNDLGNRIHFMGYENDKAKIYNSLDLVINYTVIPEAFPYSVLEAMAYGKIVIAPNIGGPKEIITEDKNGFLVEPNNTYSLKSKLEFVVNELYSRALNSISQNARKTIEEKFSLAEFIRKYEELLFSLLN